MASGVFFFYLQALQVESGPPIHQNGESRSFSGISKKWRHRKRRRLRSAIPPQCVLDLRIQYMLGRIGGGASKPPNDSAAPPFLSAFPFLVDT